MRYLVLALLVLALWRGLERLGSRLRGGGPAARPPGPPPPRGAVTEVLVRCHRCGVHLPRSRALAAAGRAEGRWFCSPACRDASG